MMNGSGVEFCLLIIEVIFVALIGGGLLKASCALFNLLAGSPGKTTGLLGRYSGVATSEVGTATLVPNSGGDDSESSAITTAPLAKPALRSSGSRQDMEDFATGRGVPQPSYEWAMCIFFVVILVNGMCCFILMRVFHLAGQATGSSVLKSMPAALILYPLGFLIQAGINTLMLPTSFGKGLLIALIVLLLCIFLAALLFTILLLTGVAIGLRDVFFG